MSGRVDWKASKGFGFFNCMSGKHLTKNCANLGCMGKEVRASVTQINIHPPGRTTLHLKSIQDGETVTVKVHHHHKTNDGHDLAIL